MEDKFDAIIVGGGIAGSLIALLLARAGLEVMLVERGNYGGAKNMTGGRLYSHIFEELIPGFTTNAPLERKVARERISMMTETAATMLEYSSSRLTREGKDSYTVLRGIFDRWLLEQAENAGALVVTGIRVDDLSWQGGKVAGIKAGEEEMLADVVVLADGVNSLLTEKGGLRKTPVLPSQMAVGAKEVIEFNEEIIEDRFGLNPGEGLSWLFAGYPSDGHIGGGLLYTNKTSVSLGIVVTLEEFKKAGKTIHEMLENFKNHPSIRPLIKGGKLVEYSGHMVPEAGISMIPDLVGDGLLVTGDAAGLVINAGYTVRGMDLAAGSAKAAAQTIITAKIKGDFSKTALGTYTEILKTSFVMRDMEHMKKFSHFMENKRIFTAYPHMADEIMENIFVVDGKPPKSLLSKLSGPAGKVGLINLIRDGIGAVRSL